ncbi:MAG: YihY/virulence factor BrkB family protein [Polyangiaceae bacterium]
MEQSLTSWSAPSSGDGRLKASAKAVVRVINRARENDVPMVAGSVAFFCVLALLPLSIAAISVYGLVFDRHDVVTQMQSLTRVLPWRARQLLAQELLRIVDSPTLGAQLSLGLVFSLWSASSGTQALIEGLSLARGKRDTRSYLRLRALAILMTLGMLLLGGLMLGWAALTPGVWARFGLHGAAASVAQVLRQLFLPVAVAGGLAAVYRYAPDGYVRRWSNVIPAAVVGTLLWLAASVGLSVFLSHVASFGRTYGALAGVIGLFLWFYLSALAVLIGAQVEAEVSPRSLRPARPKPAPPANTPVPRTPLGPDRALRGGTAAEAELH